MVPLVPYMANVIIINEKPSVSTEFSKILGVQQSEKHDGYIEGYSEFFGCTIWITWAVGHLVALSYPEVYDEKYKSWNIEDLPFIPETYKYEVIGSVKKQFSVVKKLLNSVGTTDADKKELLTLSGNKKSLVPSVEIFYAGDAGREGLYIQKLIRMMAGHNINALEKVVWIDSQTREEVLRGIKEAKSLSAYDNLGYAGFLRAIEDYLMGINFSRALTVQYGKLLNSAAGTSKYHPISVGRVMTCVLGMIVRKEYAIKDFKPTIFYKIASVIHYNGVDIVGEWKAVEGSPYFESPKVYDNMGFLKEEDAKAFISMLPPDITISELETTIEKKKAPLLFNLAELQSECSKQLKIDPSETLEIAQSLYEKKLTTYPRTDARVLSTAMAKEIKGNIEGLKSFATVQDYAGEVISNNWYSNLEKTKYVDDSKITDHYAIIPTGNIKEIANLSEIEKSVYLMIVKRFLAIFYPAAQYEKVSIEEDANGEKFYFSGKYMVREGYLKLYEKNTEEEEKQTVINTAKSLEKGQKYHSQYNTKQGQTSAPRRYTSGTIVLAMENAGQLIEDEELREQIKGSGIGTSATRAETVKKLCSLEYIKIEKKTQLVYPMNLGFMVYEIVALTFPSLLSPEMTASWEKGLAQVENGTVAKEEYQSKLNSYTKNQIEKFKGLDVENIITAKISPFASSTPKRVSGEIVSGIKCPKCGSEIKTSKYGYMCSAYNKNGGCTFAIGEMGGKLLSEKQVKQILENKKSELIKGFKAKSGNKFDAYIVMDEDCRFSYEFQTREEQQHSDYKCPLCRKGLTNTKYNLQCECGLKIPKELAGRIISDTYIKQLITKGETSMIKGFKSKAGKPFSAKLKLNGNKVEFNFGK